jgi:hypothetical protein
MFDSMVPADHRVCGFATLRAAKPHTIEMDSTAGPEPDKGLPSQQ